MDFSEFVLVGAVIAGATELLNRVRAKDFWVVATILTSAVVGGVFGATDYYPNLDVVEGVVYGLAASGALTALGSVGNKSVATESTVTKRNV